MKPKQVIVSALGVREGLLYSLLQPHERTKDALIAAAQDLNLLRSRSPVHGDELIRWTDRFMSSSGLDETADEKRYRHAACLLAVERGALVLRLEGDFAALAGERVFNRLKQLARLIGREPVMATQ